MSLSQIAAIRSTGTVAGLQNNETGKGYLLGTHRMRDPAETYARIAPLFSRMGLTRVADVTGLDNIGIPVCMAVRPNSKSLSVSQGKGSTLMAAKVSAAMESIELFHAENIETELVTASYSELSRRAVTLEPQASDLMPKSHYHPDLPIQWMLGYDLLSEEEIYVPYEMVSMDFSRTPNDLNLFWQSSNGLASGNHIFEALSHAICEVIERDALVWWKAPNNENGRSFIDLATIDSPVIRNMLSLLERAGMETYLTHRPSPTKMTVVDCMIFAPGMPAYAGHGCHLSREVAVLRAITEAAQSRLTLIAGSRDDMYWSDYHAGTHEAAREYLNFLRKITPAENYYNLPSSETASLIEDVNRQLSMLSQSGYERVIAFDLTKPEIGISVARVIIPGMDVEHKDSADSQKSKKYRLRNLMDWFYEK